MLNTRLTQHDITAPETAAGGCPADGLSAFTYAGYWFSRGVPLADH